MEIAEGMIVGLGTGSTVAFLIEALGRRVAAGLRVEGIATSNATEAAGRAVGIPIIDLAPLARIDLCIDGVDEIDEDLRAIKGAGGAMLREKIVATAADRVIAIADETKQHTRIGNAAIPIEVLPMAQGVVAAAVARLHGEPRLRRGRDDMPVRSDQGNLIIDAMFGTLDDPARVANALSLIPGVLGHGLFLTEIDELYLGTARGVIKSTRPLPR